MQYHKLGASDMNLSALSIGTWAIGGANWGETVVRRPSVQCTPCLSMA